MLGNQTTYLKPMPSIARTTSNVAMFFAMAPGIMKMTPMRSVVTYIIRRPYSSLSGANIIGPDITYREPS